MYQPLVPGGGAACHAQGPSHHWSRLQCSGCTGAAGPASVPACLGAAWYGRVEAGTAARAGAGRKEEKLAPNCTHKVAPTNLDNHRLRETSLFAQAQCRASSPMPRPAHHSHNAQKPKQLPPSKGHAAAPSPTSHRQASGNTSATPALCPLTVIILGGVSVQVPAPEDCSLPEEAHVPDGLVLQLRPKQGVGLGQDGNEPAAKGPNLLSAPAARGQGPGSRDAAASRGWQKDCCPGG